MNNKKLVALICSVLLLVGAAGATLAWLTDQTQKVTNTFTISDINITLEETDADGNEDADNNSYKMIPGSDIAKDPKVTVEADSEECYLFIKVKELGSATVGETTYGFSDYINYSVISGWTPLAGNEGVYYRVVAASDADQEFNIIQDKDGDVNYVSVNSTVTKEMMNALEAAGAVLPSLTFKAFAVQTAHIDSAELAWAEIPAAEKVF